MSSIKLLLVCDANFIKQIVVVDSPVENQPILFGKRRHAYGIYSFEWLSNTAHYSKSGQHKDMKMFSILKPPSINQKPGNGKWLLISKETDKVLNISAQHIEVRSNIIWIMQRKHDILQYVEF